ncbi:MAG: hypothetical protein JOY80_08875 [Candidatus Dormibacteraeota bacterium]|nr:hypothetical protein [Candidatus Dormibacteraeota bacterium]
MGHAPTPLVTTYENYPAGVNMMWNTWIPAAGFVLWPVTALWGAVASYNVVMTLGIVLGSWFAFLLIRRHVASTLPAAAGGLVYGFCPMIMAQALGHEYLVLSAVTVPLVVMLVEELLVRQRMRKPLLAFLIAAVGIVQFFISEEIFVTELIAAVVLGAVLAGAHHSEVRQRARYAWRVLLPAAIAVGIVLVVPIAVQLTGPSRASGAIHSADIFLTDPLNLVLPTSVQWISPGLLQHLTTHFTGNASEWDGYLGVPLLGILVYVLIRFWRVALVRVTGLTTIVIGILSLGPHLHGIGRVTPIPLPWWIPAHLPLLQDIQPNRLMLYVYLGAAIGLAFALQHVAKLRFGAARALALGVVALIPLVPAFPLPNSPRPPLLPSSVLAAIPQDSVVLMAPWTDETEATGMVLQAAADYRYRAIGGYYIGPDSNAFQVHDALSDIQQSGMAPPLNNTNRAAMLQELTSDNVSVAVAFPSPHQGVFVAFLTTVLGAPPMVIDGSDVWLLGSTAR